MNTIYAIVVVNWTYILTIKKR